MERTRALVQVLSHADRSSVIGLGILIFLDNKGNICELVNELFSLTDEDPAFLERVVGKKAMMMLADLRVNPEAFN